MKILSVDIFAGFECVGDKCPICCCGGFWTIDIDKHSEEFYRLVEGEFGKKLKDEIVSINGKATFKLNNKGECPFLNENKLCDIYRELGADNMCLTCKTYPRSFFRVGDILICYLTNSCPEVNRIIMQRIEPFEFLFDDSGNFGIDYAENILNEEPADMDWNRFNHAVRAFTIGIDILQNREITISNRLILLALYIGRFQEIMEKNRNPTDLSDVFSTPELYKVFFENNLVEKRDFICKLHSFMMVFSLMLKSSYDHPMWEECTKLADLIATKNVKDIDNIKEAYKVIDNEDVQIELEQIMLYRFFVSFMKGYKENTYMDNLAYEYVLYAALLTYIAEMQVEQGHTCTKEERILFYSLCSRIDHTWDTKGYLLRAIRKEGYNELEIMLKLVN